MQFALTYAQGVFDTHTKIMGRQSAGLGFLRAALAADTNRLWCYAARRSEAEAFGRDVLALSKTPPELRFIAWDQSSRLVNAGTLYRADPGISEDGWRRQTHSLARAYSLCGVTHTLSTHMAMTTLAGLVTAPLFPWDAVICTSRAARDIVRNLLEAEMEKLKVRVGATRFAQPQFPLIPLGVHCSDFDFSTETRAKSRKRLGLEPSEVAVLFAGRLTFHGKAHPLPMFLGLEEAIGRTGGVVSMLLFGQFPNQAVKDIFLAEAALLAPSVRLVVLDGSKPEDREAAWSGADIFTSLSDNVQETFGLTPVEAMAAGLPVVVSDWDGYKDTVRHGIDGFRVPTYLPPPGTGIDLADRFEAQIDNYDHHMGHVSLFTAVDITATAEAYTRLIENADLRQEMGSAGRRRARECFDWSVIFARYQSLWDDLAEHRRSWPTLPGETPSMRRPDRPDPFTLFRTFSSGHLGEGTGLRRRPGGDLSQAIDRLRLGSVAYAAPVLPSVELLTAILDNLPLGKTLRHGELRRAIKAAPHAQIDRAVTWLVKMGIMDIEAER